MKGTPCGKSKCRFHFQGVIANYFANLEIGCYKEALNIINDSIGP
jgi:hypothetical protein